MAISAYSKTTYANGTTPAINATNLNNIEQQVADITSAATADGANPTKIWTSTNDGNAGQPPAPKPQYTSPYTQIGTFYDSNLADATGWTNPGGTWLIMAIKWATATGAIINITSAVTTGNLAAPSAGERYSIWTWRIA